MSGQLPYTEPVAKDDNLQSEYVGYLDTASLIDLLNVDSSYKLLRRRRRSSSRNRRRRFDYNLTFALISNGSAQVEFN